MRVITNGLTEHQRLEAVMKGARVDEHRAGAMVQGRAWDAVVVAGRVVVGPSVFDAASDRSADSAIVGGLLAVHAHARYGDAVHIGDSTGTFLVTPVGGEAELVRP